MKENILNTIRRKLHRIAGTTIIQFGPPRSGTTLVYNILKDVFLHRSVETRHYYRDKDKRFPTVVTYRNPLDSIASSILRYKAAPTYDKLKQQVSEFEVGILTVLEIKNNSNVLMLKYENFYNNFEYIFNEISNFFDIKISFKKRNLISESYNLDSVDKICKKMKSYKEIDKKTLFHGNHINVNRGRSNFHKEFFKKDQIIYLENIYKKFLTSFNYI